MSKLGSNFVALLNMETDRWINLMIKSRQLNQCEISIYCNEFIFIPVYSVLDLSYLLLQKLTFPIHCNYELLYLILYLILCFALVCVF